MSHGWRGGPFDQVCPRRIHRFLEPCLLLLFHCHQSHGYELLEELRPFGFGNNPADLSTVCRILRGLEDRRFATSHWDTSSAGPARRHYTITDAGDRHLAWRVQGLRETGQALRTFLDTKPTRRFASEPVR